MLAGEVDLIALSVRDGHGQRISKALSHDDLSSVRSVSSKEKAVRAATCRVWERHRLLRATEKKESPQDLERTRQRER